MSGAAKFWLTRPRQYAERTASALAECGCEAVVYPLLHYRLTDAQRIDIGGGDAIIFTSSFAVEAFCFIHNMRSAVVYCVGDSTAKAARDLGFADVRSADGDVDDLLHLIIGTADKVRRLWHFAAAETAGDLAGELRTAGFTVELVVLYEVSAEVKLSDDLCAMLKAGAIAGVLLYSPKTAKVFTDLLRQYDLVGHLKTVPIFCLSDNVAKAVQAQGLQSVTAAQPKESSLLEAVRQFAS